MSYKVHTVKDFAVGRQVSVAADQGIRKGYVTKLGRTRISVRHPRNARGILVERAYPMSAVVVGWFPAPWYGTHRGKTYQTYVCADGNTYTTVSNPPYGLPRLARAEVPA